MLRRLENETNRNLDCQECDCQWPPETLLHGLEAMLPRREADYQLDFLYHEKKVPCPRTFILRPAEPEILKLTSWPHVIGKRFELTLVSELSGKEVASKEFTIPREWTTWIGPLTRMASLALTGLVLPLEGEIAERLTESADTMEKLAALPTDEGERPQFDETEKARHREGRLVATDPQIIRQLEMLLQTIGLDPGASGMALAETLDGRWLWMTIKEAEAHSGPEARFCPESSCRDGDNHRE